MGANRLLPIIAGLILLMLVVVGVKTTRQASEPVHLAAVPQAGRPDVDSPADTIRTLTAEVAVIKSESEKLQMQNEALLKQRDEIETRVKAELQSQLAQDTQQQANEAVSQLAQQVDYFKNRLDQLSTSAGQTLANNGNDIPIGFGIGADDGLQAFESPLTWIEPLGTQSDDKGQPILKRAANGAESLLHGGQQVAGTTEAYLTESASAITEPDRPVYTVPRNATLIGATGMTALIGRIPIKGTIEDPFPFKVIVGRDNLAANGIEMSGLDGIVFSGKASGDWTLSCVRGEVLSATYVFADGTIRTLSADDDTLSRDKRSSGAGTGNASRTLGWISDRRGIPCVTGTRISNAAGYLSGRILASAVEAAAGAFSQSQVTNSVSAAQGVATSVITGDASKYAGGKALAGGATEIGEYLRERGAQSFDVVYVDTGSELAIHIDVALPIDYEPGGRKTQYDLAENEVDDELD
jgi:integrating conjugative element protein (TIGR03752 family)